MGLLGALDVEFVDLVLDALDLATELAEVLVVVEVAQDGVRVRERLVRLGDVGLDRRHARLGLDNEPVLRVEVSLYFRQLVCRAARLVPVRQRVSEGEADGAAERTA